MFLMPSRKTLTTGILKKEICEGRFQQSVIAGKVAFNRENLQLRFGQMKKIWKHCLFLAGERIKTALSTQDGESLSFKGNGCHCT